MIFPYYKLPTDITSDDALVLASGPSFDDYLVDDLAACPAKKYGCGNVTTKLGIDVYALGDAWVHLENTPTSETSRVFVTTTVIEDMKGIDHPKKSSFELLNESKGHYSASAGNMILSIASVECRRAYVLGFDGYFTSVGRPRQRVHANGLYTIDQARQMNLKPQFFRDELKQVSVASRCQERSNNLYNLVPNCTLPLPLASGIAEQPYAHIDRHGRLLVVEEPQDIQRFMHLGLFWRAANPRLAVVVIVPNMHLPANAIRDFVYLPQMPTDDEMARFEEVEIIGKLLP